MDAGASPLETALALLYADPAALAAFLAAPEDWIAAQRVDADTAAALREVDRVGLVMAARSYTRKREQRRPRGARR